MSFIKQTMHSVVEQWATLPREIQLICFSFFAESTAYDFVTVLLLNRFWCSQKNNLLHQISNSRSIDHILLFISHGKQLSISSDEHRFLRHQNHVIKAHKDDKSELFAKDASWIVHVVSLKRNLVSFQSVNYLNHFIICNSSYQVVNSDSKRVILDRGSWTPIPTTNGFYLAHQLSVFLGVLGHDSDNESCCQLHLSNTERPPDYWVSWHILDGMAKNWRPCYSISPMTVSQKVANNVVLGARVTISNSRNDFISFDGNSLTMSTLPRVWIIRHALYGNGISFESESHPDHYIRHCNWTLWLHQRDDSLLFQKDASFVVGVGLSEKELPFFVSFESANYPHYCFALCVGGRSLAIEVVSDRENYPKRCSWKLNIV